MTRTASRKNSNFTSVLQYQEVAITLGVVDVDAEQWGEVHYSRRAREPEVGADDV